MIGGRVNPTSEKGSWPERRCTLCMLYRDWPTVPTRRCTASKCVIAHRVCWPCALLLATEVGMACPHEADEATLAMVALQKMETTA